MKYCNDLKKIIDFNCCDSCHDDLDYGYDDMIYCDFQGEEYHICCAGYNAIEAFNKPPDTVTQKAE